MRWGHLNVRQDWRRLGGLASALAESAVPFRHPRGNLEWAVGTLNLAF